MDWSKLLFIASYPRTLLETLQGVHFSYHYLLSRGLIKLSPPTALKEEFSSYPSAALTPEYLICCGLFLYNSCNHHFWAIFPQSLPFSKQQYSETVMIVFQLYCYPQGSDSSSEIDQLSILHSTRVCKFSKIALHRPTFLHNWKDKKVFFFLNGSLNSASLHPLLNTLGKTSH